MMKAGLIGNGYWGEILKTKLEKHFDLVFVADSKTDYDPSEVDWIFIATPVSTHYELTKKCLEVGTNVFCEKPFTGDPIKSKELMGLAEEKGLKLYIDNIFLGRVEYKRIKINKDLIRSGDIKFTWHKYGPFNDNIMNDLLYHDIYLSLDMLGVSHNPDILFVRLNGEELKVGILFGSTMVLYNYDRISHTREKSIRFGSKILYLEKPMNDPLDEIVENISMGGNIDYNYNWEITQKTEKILQQVWAH